MAAVIVVSIALASIYMHTCICMCIFVCARVGNVGQAAEVKAIDRLLRFSGDDVNLICFSLVLLVVG